MTKARELLRVLEYGIKLGKYVIALKDLDFGDDGFVPKGGELEIEDQDDKYIYLGLGKHAFKNARATTSRLPKTDIGVVIKMAESNVDVGDIINAWYKSGSGTKTHSRDTHGSYGKFGGLMHYMGMKDVVDGIKVEVDWGSASSDNAIEDLKRRLSKVGYTVSFTSKSDNKFLVHKEDTNESAYKVVSTMKHAGASVEIRQNKNSDKFSWEAKLPKTVLPLADYKPYATAKDAMSAAKVLIDDHNKVMNKK